MKIAVSSPPFPATISEGLSWIKKLAQQAAARQAEIICFPESYIPGYPALDFIPEERSPEKLQIALNKVCAIAAAHNIAIIIPMDWYRSPVYI